MLSAAVLALALIPVSASGAPARSKASKELRQARESRQAPARKRKAPSKLPSPATDPSLLEELDALIAESRQ